MDIYNIIYITFIKLKFLCNEKILYFIHKLQIFYMKYKINLNNLHKINFS